MPTFGARSLHHLGTCHPDLQRVLTRAIRSYDFAVLEGHRGEAAQNRAFETGNSEKRWPEGKHNSFPSNAADLSPWLKHKPKGEEIPWKDPRPWYMLAGVILAAAEAERVKVRLGADWDGDQEIADQKFHDLGHVELVRD